MRLFVALPLPDSIKKETLPILEAIPAGRRAKDHQLHLTLAFLGDVPEQRRSELSQALGQVQMRAFSTQLKGVGCFPNPKRSRVLWVGMEPWEELSQLKTKIEAALEPLGFPKEKRKFQPHITISRIKRPHPHGVQSFLNQFMTFTSSSFEALHFTLFSSQLTPQGSLYTQLQEFPLQC